MTESLWSTMNVIVRNREIPNTFCSVLYCWHVFYFGFPYKFDVCMVGKKLLYSLIVYTNESNRLFPRVHKILRWIGSNDFNIYHILMTFKKQFPWLVPNIIKKNNVIVDNTGFIIRFDVRQISCLRQKDAKIDFDDFD